VAWNAGDAADVFLDVSKIGDAKKLIEQTGLAVESDEPACHRASLMRAGRPPPWESVALPVACPAGAASSMARLIARYTVCLCLQRRLNQPPNSL
jgi:hypothetical protein